MRNETCLSAEQINSVERKLLCATSYLNIHFERTYNKELGYFAASAGAVPTHVATHPSVTLVD
jgi:hypothetical protein